MHYYKTELLPVPDELGEIECECGIFYDMAVDESCPVCAEFIIEPVQNETEYAY